MTNNKNTEDLKNEYFFLKILAGLYVDSQERLIKCKHLAPVLNCNPEEGFSEVSSKETEDIMVKHLQNIKLLFEKEKNDIDLPGLRELIIDLLDGALTYYQEIFLLLDKSLQDESIIKSPS